MLFFFESASQTFWLLQMLPTTHSRSSLHLSPTLAARATLPSAGSATTATAAWRRLIYGRVTYGVIFHSPFSRTKRTSAVSTSSPLARWTFKVALLPAIFET